MHSLFPVPSWYHPPGHATHDAEVLTVKDPLSQGTQLERLPEGTSHPSGHHLQALFPEPPWYHLTGHFLQAFRSLQPDAL